MENLTHPAAPLSTGSSLSDTMSETGGVSGLNSSDNLELQKSLVRQKEAELKEMQDQIESFNQMVKQLTSQRELAIKRLADMDMKIKEMTNVLDTERHQTDAKDQELKSKRTQLQTLKNEEDQLKSEIDCSQRDLDVTKENLATIRLSSSQVNGKVSDLKRFLSTAKTTIEDIEKAIECKDTMRLSSICSQPLSPPPLSVNTILTNGKTDLGQCNEPRPVGADGAGSYDPFADDDPFEGDDPFAGDDPFTSDDANLILPEDDPFNPSSAAASNAPFSASPLDPFASIRRPMDGF